MYLPLEEVPSASGSPRRSDMAWTVKKIWAPAVKSRKATIAIKFVFRLPNPVKLFFSVITLPFRLDRIRLLPPDAQARLVQQRCCMKYDYSVPRHAAHAGWLLELGRAHV